MARPGTVAGPGGSTMRLGQDTRGSQEVPDAVNFNTILILESWPQRVQELLDPVNFITSLMLECWMQKIQEVPDALNFNTRLILECWTQRV